MKKTFIAFTLLLLACSCKKAKENPPLPSSIGSNYINWNTGTTSTANLIISPDSSLLVIGCEEQTITIMLQSPQPITQGQYNSDNSSIQVTIGDTIYYDCSIDITHFGTFVQGRFVATDGWVYYTDSIITAMPINNIVRGNFNIQ